MAYIVRGDMDVWLRTREGGGDEAGLIQRSYTWVGDTSWGAQHVYRVGGKWVGCMSGWALTPYVDGFG